MDVVQEPCSYLVQTPACDIKEKEGAGTEGEVVLCGLEIKRKDVLRAGVGGGVGHLEAGPERCRLSPGLLSEKNIYFPGSWLSQNVQQWLSNLAI